MEKFKFSSEDNQIIINAIIEGYRDYIEHRQERNQEMIISSAFAWTKGNFIESRIAQEKDSLNITYKKAKAGLTWDYLQFVQQDTNKLFLIKNAAYFDANCFSQAILATKNKGARRTYLHELSKINLKIFSENNEQSFSVADNKQLAFLVLEDQVKEELEEVQSSFDEFHILTYAIDEAYQISEIIHYLPNPINNIAYKVEDLSNYISGAELSDEEREVIAPEYKHDILDPAAFDIGIYVDDESQDS